MLHRDVPGDVATSTTLNVSAPFIRRPVAPILILGVHSASLTTGQVYDIANSILAQKISQLKGVGQVFVGGGQSPAVRVQVDPTALASAGLGMEDLRAAIGKLTSNQAKGS